MQSAGQPSASAVGAGRRSEVQHERARGAQRTGRRCRAARPRRHVGGLSPGPSSPRGACQASAWTTSLVRRHDHQPQRGAAVAGIADGRVAELFEVLDEVTPPVSDWRLSMCPWTSKNVSRRCAWACRNAIASGGRRVVGLNKWRWHEVLYAGAGAAPPARCVHACPVRACPAPAGSAVEHERVAMAICCGDGIRRDGHAPARRLHRLGLASLGGPAYRAAK